jgi:hypothetical protein
MPEKKLTDEVPALGTPISAEEAGLRTDPEATQAEWGVIKEAFNRLEVLAVTRGASERNGVQRMRELVNCENFADVGATADEEALVKRLAARMGSMKRLRENVNSYMGNT